MLLVMAVSLYTSRIILNILGVNDFGTYNVVGGIVGMFGFFSGAMTTAAQRFFSYYLGQKDYHNLQKVFSVTLILHIVISLIIVLLAETIGLWFVNNYLNIPCNRMEAARWVYHLSILAFVVSIVRIPYNALIVAYEEMSVYAYVGIIEAFLKLAVVFMLSWVAFDKLKLYAFLLFVVALFIMLIYKFYVDYKFKKQVYFSFVREKSIYKNLISYSGWNLWGSSATVIMSEGINILVNIFFGVAVNAARGIAYQIDAALNQFVVNFQMAINPQIIKSYATDDLPYMNSLIFSGAKLSFYLPFILSLPILLETEVVLRLWLKIVPEYAVVFSRLVLVGVLIDGLSGTLTTAAQASGKIKLYQFVVGGLLILRFPVTYVFYSWGFQPQIAFGIGIVISVLALFIRLLIVQSLVGIDASLYIKKVLPNVAIVTLLSLVVPFCFHLVMDEDFLRFAVVLITSLVSVLFSIYYVGLNKNEKAFIVQKIQNVIKKYKS